MTHPADDVVAFLRAKRDGVGLRLRGLGVLVAHARSIAFATDAGLVRALNPGRDTPAEDDLGVATIEDAPWADQLAAVVRGALLDGARAGVPKLGRFLVVERHAAGVSLRVVRFEPDWTLRPQ